MRAGTMSILSTKTTILDPGVAGGVGTPSYPMSVCIQNLGGEDLFVGGPDVNTTDKGFKLVQGSNPMSFDVVGEGLYGICVTGPLTIQFIRRG